MPGIDRAATLAELAPAWLEGLDDTRRAEGERLLEEVVADWAREADPTPDPEAVLAIQRADLEAAAAGRDAGGRLEVLRVRVLTRRTERLSVETLALGRAILAGSVPDDEARRRGRELLARAEQLGPELRDGSPELDPARRELSSAVMEALYAVERQAMSPRLAREAPGGGPPDVR